MIFITFILPFLFGIMIGIMISIIIVDKTNDCDVLKKRLNKASKQHYCNICGDTLNNYKGDDK